MLINANVQFFFALLLYWTSLGVSLKWGEQIWCLNLKIYRGENTTSQSLQFELRSHGPIYKLWYLEYS